MVMVHDGLAVTPMGNIGLLMVNDGQQAGNEAAETWLMVVTFGYNQWLMINDAQQAA